MDESVFLYARTLLSAAHVSEIFPVVTFGNDGDCHDDGLLLIKDNSLELRQFSLPSTANNESSAVPLINIIQQPLFGHVAHAAVLFNVQHVSSDPHVCSPASMSSPMRGSSSSLLPVQYMDPWRRSLAHGCYSLENDALLICSTHGTLSLLIYNKESCRFVSHQSLDISTISTKHSYEYRLVTEPLCRAIALCSPHTPAIFFYPIKYFDSEWIGAPIVFDEDRGLLPGKIIGMDFTRVSENGVNECSLVVLFLSPDLKYFDLQWISYVPGKWPMSKARIRLPWTPSDYSNPVYLTASPIHSDTVFIITEYHVSQIKLNDIVTGNTNWSQFKWPGNITRGVTGNVQVHVLSHNFYTRQGTHFLCASSSKGDIWRLVLARTLDNAQYFVSRHKPASNLSSMFRGDTLIILSASGDGEFLKVTVLSLLDADYLKHNEKGELSRRDKLHQWAPVADFLPFRRENKLSLIACCGHVGDGCLREIRSAMSFKTLLSFDRPVGAQEVWSLSVPWCNNGTLFCITFCNVTQLLFVSQNTQIIEDASDEFQFRTDCRTICAYSCNLDTNPVLVQIHEHGVTTIMFTGLHVASNWVTNETSIITCSHHSRNIVALYSGSDTSLTILQLSNSGDVVIYSVLSKCCINISVSAIFIINSTSCLVGTLDSRLLLLTLHQGAWKLEATFFIASSEWELCTGIPECIAYADGVVLVGLRNGYIFRCNVQVTQHGYQFSTPSSQRLGKIRVRLAQSDPSSLVGTLIVCESLWIATMSSTDLCMSFVSGDMIVSASFVDSGVFTVVLPECIQIIWVDPMRQFDVSKLIGRTTPRHVLFDRKLNIFIVSCLTQPKLGEITSELRLIDTNGRLLLTRTFQPNEIVYGLADWYYTEQDRSIIVGLYNKSAAKKERGPLLIFSLLEMLNSSVIANINSSSAANQNDSRRFQLKCVCVHTFEDVPLCIQALSHRYLLVSSGKTLHMMHMEHQNKQRALLSDATFVTRYLISGMDVSGNQIALMDERDSILLLRANQVDPKIEYIASDLNAHFGSSVCFVNDQLLAGVDKNGNIYGVSCSSSATQTGTLAEIFSFNMGEPATRLRTLEISLNASTLLPFEPFNDDSNSFLGSQTLYPFMSWPCSKDSAKAICSITVLGSLVFCFRIDKAAFELVKEIEAILCKHPSTSPLLGNFHSSYRSGTHNSKGTLDGDMVIQFVTVLSESERLDIVAHLECTVEKSHPIRQLWSQMPDTLDRVRFIKRLISKMDRLALLI